MERELRRITRRRRRLPDFIATILWIVPVMAVLAAAGFLAARDYFAPQFLQPSEVHAERPRPIRILSPEEASRLSTDESSHVWTKGVQESDVPEWKPEDTPSKRKTRRRHANPVVKPVTQEGTETTASPEMPSAESLPAPNTEAPSAPAADPSTPDSPPGE